MGFRAATLLLCLAACTSGAGSRRPPAPARLHLVHQDLEVDLREPRLLTGRARLTVANLGGAAASEVSFALTPFARLGEVRALGRVLSIRESREAPRRRVALAVGPAGRVILDVSWRIDLSDHATRTRLGEALRLEPGERVVELVDWHPRLNRTGEVPEKPPFRLSVTTAADEVAVAPGRVVARVRDGDRVRTTFEGEAGPAEIVVLAGRYRAARHRAAGFDFELLHTGPAPRGLGDAAALLGRALSFYEESFGPAWTERPTIRVAIAPIRGARSFRFALVLGGEGGYLGGDPGATTGNGNRRDLVLFHELAHFWWGQLLTATAREAALLHEGLAAFSALAALEHIRGPEVARSVRRALRRVALRGGPPVLGLPLATRGAGGYAEARGALIFESLRARIGERRLFEALRDLLRRRRGGAFALADLEAALTRSGGPGARRVLALARTSGVPVVRVFAGSAAVQVTNVSREWAFVPLALVPGGTAALEVAPGGQAVLRLSEPGAVPRVVVDPDARVLVRVAGADAGG